jgi:phosphoglycerol transferase MdoB-like AlkP superfamily enzyme
MDFSALLSKLPNLNFNLGSLSFAPSYLQAGAIIVLLFLLVLALAQFRRHLLDWSVKGALFGVFFGILFAFIIEGFLIIGGKTAITEVLGWRNAPQPLLGIIDAGRSKLVNVLGVSSEIPSSNAEEKPTVDGVIHLFQNLNPSDVQKVRATICEP